MSKRRTPRPAPAGLATVSVVISLPNGMRLRHTSHVGSAEAQALWATLIEDAQQKGRAQPVKP